VNNQCPGVPEQCDHARQVIGAALDGFVGSSRLTILRTELDHCRPCLQAFDLEMRFRVVMSQGCIEKAPIELRVRITEALARIDLNEVDVTDL